MSHVLWQILTISLSDLELWPSDHWAIYVCWYQLKKIIFDSFNSFTIVVKSCVTNKIHTIMLPPFSTWRTVGTLLFCSRILKSTPKILLKWIYVFHLRYILSVETLWPVEAPGGCNAPSVMTLVDCPPSCATVARTSPPSEPLSPPGSRPWVASFGGSQSAVCVASAYPR